MRDLSRWLLGLVGLLAAVSACAYLATLFVAAQVADRRADDQKRELLAGYLANAERETLLSLRAIAVSTEAYVQSADRREAAHFAPVCAKSDLAEWLPSFGVLDPATGVRFYCDFQRPGDVGAQNGFVARARLADLSGFSKALSDRDAWGQAFPDFVYVSDYRWVGDRLYLVTRALVTPAEPRTLAARRTPTLVYATRNLASTIAQYASDAMGLGAVRVARTPPGASKGSYLQIGPAAYVVWTASHQFRNQYWVAAPVMLALAGALVALVLAGLLRINALIDRIRKQEEAARHAATHDAMTGLPNRARFQALRDELINAGRPFHVGLLDLDHFKRVNDTLGHDAGDALLIEVAHRVRRTIGPHNTFARLGGDEFAMLIVTEETEHAVRRLCDAIYEAMRQPLHLNGACVQPSASLGLASFPRDAADGHSLTKAADLALYDAKRAGRGQYRLFSPEMAVSCAVAAA